MMSKVFRFVPSKNAIYDFAMREKEIVFVGMPLLIAMHYYMYKEFSKDFAKNKAIS